MGLCRQEEALHRDQNLLLARTFALVTNLLPFNTLLFLRSLVIPSHHLSQFFGDKYTYSTNIVSKLQRSNNATYSQLQRPQQAPY